MGSWDSYCAICGGPFNTLTVAQKPRSERFLRRHGLSQPQPSSSAQANHPTEDGNADTTAETGDDEAAGEAPIGTITQEDEREDGSYDRDVVTSTELAWVQDLHVLMTNENEDTGERVGCVSGVGEFYDNTQVSVDDGDDPNWDPTAEIVLYDGCFPFHWPCFEVLGTVLEGKTGIAGLNKLKLYNTMMRASGICCSRLDRLDYGDPGPYNEQWWEYQPGTEFLVVHPTISLEKTTALIRERWMKSTQVVNPSDRVRRVSADSFQKLPLELLLKTCSMLTPQSLHQLALASPTVDALLGDKPFWKQYLSVHMPWSYELLSIIDDESQTFQNADFKSLVRWVDQESTPRQWMRGPFMSIANRRRIWHVCEQLKPVYSGRAARFPPTEAEKRRMNLRRAQMGMPPPPPGGVFQMPAIGQ
ncbi:hypothetical protein TRIATDRAFT_299494 [Trichoderma atroviride IMI 206040]|uniref:F-box domain-containing protein n=1 Tax=Hypocrea atroviridis (strain ATCC 20476 / IMI 206040) TaxID=452589 RepID=G9NT86_HYPAI|nr:uncharacterized protein TRIATDRAFT_299494 [Trichoderma atroviride IMI 206040]EHK45934.1 hypothetical protein TRIATDRAFT_299494 [Trichoderma atroviride IMI 206040]